MIYSIIRKIEDGLLSIVRYTCGGEVIIVQQSDIKTISPKEEIKSSIWSSIIQEKIAQVRLPSFSVVPVRKIAMFCSFALVIMGEMFLLNSFTPQLDAAVPVILVSKDAKIFQNHGETPSLKNHYLNTLATNQEEAIQKEPDYVVPVAIPATFTSTNEDFYYINGVRIEVDGNNWVSDNYGY